MRQRILIQQLLECPGDISLVVPPFALLDVQRQCGAGDAVEFRSAALGEAPERLEVINVVPLLIHVLLGVVDAVVRVAVDFQLGESAPLVGVDDRPTLDHKPHNGREGTCVGFLDDVGVHSATALQDAEYLHLVLAARNFCFYHVLIVGEYFLVALQKRPQALRSQAAKL